MIIPSSEFRTQSTESLIDLLPEEYRPIGIALAYDEIGDRYHQDLLGYLSTMDLLLKDQGNQLPDIAREAVEKGVGVQFSLSGIRKASRLLFSNTWEILRSAPRRIRAIFARVQAVDTETSPTPHCAPGVIREAYDTSLLNKSIHNLHVINSSSSFQPAPSQVNLKKALRSYLMPYRLEEILNCGTPKEYIDANESMRAQESRCKHRLCPLCAEYRKRSRWRKDGHRVNENAQYMFITGVHGNIDEITPQSFQDLKLAVKIFMRSKAMRWVEEGIYSLEFGFDPYKESRWRMHFHLLAPIPTTIKNIRALKDAMHVTWREKSLDDLHISISGNKHDNKRRLKYLSKGNAHASIPSGDLEKLYLATEGRQLVNKFGNWLK